MYPVRVPTGQLVDCGAGDGHTPPTGVGRPVTSPCRSKSWTELAVSVVFTGAALLLWSSAMLITKTFNRRMAFYGILVGAVILIAAASGYLRLDIHGYGFVVLATGIWQIAIASELWTRSA